MADAPEEAVVYCYPWVFSALLGLVLGCLTGLGIYKKYRSVSLALLVSAIGIVNGVAERRRKIEISEDKVTYRPPVFSPRSARFQDVISIKKVSVLTVWTYLVSGMELELPNYMTMQIPLDLRNRDEVFDKITEAWKRQRRRTSEVSETAG